jgi:hypothetical protein
MGNWLLGILEKFFVGGRLWGFLRLIISISLILTFVLAGWMMHRLIGDTQKGIFSLQFWIMPLAAFIGAILVGAHYVKDVYELPSLRLGIRYLRASAFSLIYPQLRIRDGVKVLKEGEVNLLEAVGGPGYVYVTPGSIVLTERLTSPANVHGTGIHFITRQERVKETATLEDQHAHIEKLEATTKDGIEVDVVDVQYRYRLRTGRQFGDYTQRSPTEPYPYSVQAMRNLTYNRTVGVRGITPWKDQVRIAIDGVIKDYIFKHQIDFLTAPDFTQEVDPRHEINQMLFSKAARGRLSRVGAELLWADIGHIDIKEEEVDQQRLDTWAAKWVGRASVIRAYGEAQELAYQDLGRAEAQAEMLMSILHSLDEVELGDKPGENLRKVILVRTAQILEAIAEQEPSLIPQEYMLLGRPPASRPPKEKKS